MAQPTKRRIVEALLDRHGRTFAEELGIDVARGTPAPLFRLLVASILLSARIGHRIAVEAARALAKEGWTTPQKLGGATWAQRVRVLNRSGYARYDEHGAHARRHLLDSARTLRRRPTKVAGGSRA